MALLIAVVVFALRKGGGPERAMALILIGMFVADQVLHLFVPPRFASIDTGHVAIDIAAALSTLALAMVAHRFWPMLAAVLQILPLTAHVGKAVDLSVHPIAYQTMQVAASWPLLLVLALATWRHVSRARATGNDPSWHASWRRSNPTIANI
ncbi:hypothetical protein [Sphingopyxis sp. PAMC25046]|uniref:hypothetical protein n=1 Tax=Sphingopyxis sp. PAMC25046 TaxID=2565556 RepID=UPI001447B22D|nr:hypothetical protein [Sphingopyxis sp. PAMC25046]